MAKENAVMDAMSGYLASMNGLSNGLAHALQEQFKDKGLLPSFKDDLEVLNEVYRTMPDKAEKNHQYSPRKPNKI